MVPPMLEYITHVISSDQNNIQRTNHDYRKNSGNNESRSNQLKSRSIEINGSDKNYHRNLIMIVI